VGRAVQSFAWIRERRGDFTSAQLAEHLETHTRTAQRWLESWEASGMVECDRTRQPWIWRVHNAG
jgi:DNA-binding IclR family transcriptional regulator